MRVSLDRASAYNSLRRRTYGYDLVPLPKSLKILAIQEPPNPRSPTLAIAKNAVG